MRDRMAAHSDKPGMGTVITHRVYGQRAGEALKAAEAEAARLERMLSRFIPGSDIGRLNGAAGMGPVRVSAETFELLSRAVEFSKAGLGRFDVTVGPLADIWNTAKAEGPPPEAELKKALSLVDYKELVLDRQSMSARLGRKGQSVDLGGIGKGFAADAILKVFESFGIKSAFTNLGGNVALLGARPDGAPWRIGIQHPRQAGSLIGTVSVTGRSVVTSGDYQRFYTAPDGKRYHHLLDPKTGFPADGGVVSSTVIAESSTAADALSTILFVSGLERGLRVLGAFPKTEAILVDRELRVFITRGIAPDFQAAEGSRVDLL